jgi:DNA-binding HxlR family transcriptional regulator
MIRDRVRMTSCPAEAAVEMMGGKWKPRIVTLLGERTRRFGELERCLPQVSRKVLVEQLRELEADGLVHRQVYPVLPPRVEYSLGPHGQRALPLLRELREFGIEVLGIDELQEVG